MGVIENTLASTSTIASLDVQTDKHLGEMYKSYLSVGRGMNSNLYELSASDMSNDREEQGIFAEVDFTETVELPNHSSTNAKFSNH